MGRNALRIGKGIEPKGFLMEEIGLFNGKSGLNP